MDNRKNIYKYNMKRLLIIGFIIIAVVLYYFNTSYERFVDYDQKPYGYMKSGSDAPYFYRKDRYRRPYNDGFRFYKSYPEPHLEMNE
jgi:hypothetical protein